MVPVFLAHPVYCQLSLLKDADRRMLYTAVLRCPMQICWTTRTYRPRPIPARLAEICRECVYESRKKLTSTVDTSLLHALTFRVQCYECTKRLKGSVHGCVTTMNWTFVF